MSLSSQLCKPRGVEDARIKQTIRCWEQEEFAEAEKLMQQIADEQEQILGRDDKETLLSRYRLATILYTRRRYREAETIAREAVDGTKRNLGLHHKSTLHGKAVLGQILFARKHYRDAERILRQVVDGLEWKHMPNTNSRLEAEARVMLGRALYEQHKYSQAGDILQQGLYGWRMIFEDTGEYKEYMHDAQHWLASVFYRQEKYSDAEPLFRAARDGLMLLNGLEQITMRTSYWLIKMMYQQKRYSEAEELLQQTVVGSKKIPGKDDPLAQKIRELDEKLKLKLKLASSSDLATTISQSSVGRLESFFQKKQENREPYTDSEIMEIASLLGLSNTSWSKVPRTYILLRTIGHLDLLDEMINEGFSDIWFPVTKRRLPDCLSPSALSAISGTQYLVLTKSMDLEKGHRGQHCYFDDSDTLPLQEQGILGTGGFGQVDKVISLISFKTYARKRVRRSLAFRDRKEHINLFIDEIQLLKRLKHRHVVEFVGSYTDTTYFGLIMSPVAKTDLGRYLTDCTVARHPELRTFFGCLATALEFLHGENIRHKDIKPGNILVEISGNILFADFGLSLDFMDADGSTTTGMVRYFTPRYCAPEVAAREKRNTKSDIWSLGLVFIEMIVVLKGKTRQDVDAFFEQHGSERTYIHANIDALPEFIAALEGMGQLSDNIAFSWVRQMLCKKQRLRPTACSLVTSILASTGFCGICCLDSEGGF